MLFKIINVNIVHLLGSALFFFSPMEKRRRIIIRIIDKRFVLVQNEISLFL